MRRWSARLLAGFSAGVLAIGVLGGCSLFKKKEQATAGQAGGTGTPPAAGTGQGPATGGGSGDPLPVELAAPMGAVMNFMNARLRGEPLDPFLALAAPGTRARPSLSNPRMVDFEVASGKVVEGTPTFEVLSYWQNGGTGASVLTEEIAVAGGKTYAISSLSERGEVSAYARDGAIYRRQGTDERKLAVLSDLPAVMRPRAADPGVEFGVSRDRVTRVSLSPDGGTVAFCTGGVHGTLAVVTAGGASGASATASSTATSLRPLDIFPQSDCDGVAWSPDGKWMAVTVLGPAPSHSLHVWQTDGWQARRVELKSQRPTLSRLRWQDRGFTFEEKVEDGRTAQMIYRPDSGRLEAWSPAGS